ncbi:hypothetical protein PHYSODRAFT_329444 [Phytophthora sojae]|uniref:Uncharacterized protein n=1 Tax=Phytophthora sojae (strain P6497) TaxID=1094619 RepID=G4Z3E5_PHYSP|nr:hypothetical protein PHYSODRAFT_329444 [Phytophthora sojae]EGZ21508.1 hypothetical protein PHYSODRAFT_329444 [Phytophthora sojae]|eukprot:XP_009524225.1 hypothetical protein PHYSODRAFT_329444 [Phytophthora sojae]
MGHGFSRIRNGTEAARGEEELMAPARRATMHGRSMRELNDGINYVYSALGMEKDDEKDEDFVVGDGEEDDDEETALSFDESGSRSKAGEAMKCTFADT